MDQDSFIWHYAQNHAIPDLQKYSQEVIVSTGFENIDKEMNGFPPCLGLLVAGSSIGKTAFALQLGDQLAQQGENVIFVSYESTKLEVWARLMTRHMKLKNPNSEFSSFDIVCNRAYNDPIFHQTLDEMRTNTQINLRVWVPDEDGNIPWLINKLSQTINAESHLKKPFVIVDYTQVIPHLGDIKQMLDKEIPKLKQFQMKTGCTILLISSTSRSNYFKSLSLDAPKESGILESSASIVWVLQPSILDKRGDDPMSGDDVEEYKRQDMRKITLKCLKHRQGKDFTVYFKYYPKYELFVEKTSSQAPFKNLKVK